MKKIIFYTIIISVCFLGSCDLDRIPETNLSDFNFWLSESNFKDACNLFYINLDGQSLFFDDLRSDFAYNQVQGANGISSGTRIVPATTEDWNKPYRIIFSANNIIEKAEGKENIFNIDRWVAEARFFRAYAYFNLVSKFGDVPLVLRVLDIDSPELEEPSTERGEVIRQIYDDLDFAAKNLPAFSELNATEYGRVSRSAALAYKARVALYEGTRQKFHEYGDFSENLSVAISAAEKVMEERHELLPSYFDLFQLEGEGFHNKETILPIIYGVDDSDAIRAHAITQFVVNGWYCVTKSLVDLYLCSDGLPYEKSPLAENPESDYLSVFKNKDPRMNASIFKIGDPFVMGQFDPTTARAVVSGFCARKFFNADHWVYGSSYIDIPMIRYAEVLLIYAEANFELNGSISDTELDKSINLLRGRVSMPPLSNSFVNANGLDMRTEIRRERCVELAQEGFRYDDIIRWKIAEKVLIEEMKGARYFEVYGERIVSSDGYLLVQPAATRYFDNTKDYLYPIPTREIALSGGAIIQNPGW